MSSRARVLLALSIVVVLVGGIVAWRVAGGDDPSDAPEHASHGPGKVEQPEFDVRTVQAGQWSDPSTWSVGRPPAEGDVVHVEHPVTMDAPDAQSGEMWLNAPLQFDASKTAMGLTMHGSLVVDRGGVLEIRQPDPKKTATLSFDVDDEQAMKGGFNFVPEDIGLWILSGGRTELHGAPVNETWANLATPAAEGRSELHVHGDVSDWPPGAEAIVSGTNLGRQAEHELVRVRRIESEGDSSKITLQKPLAFAHDATDRFAGEIGLLTHNVKIKSLDPKNRAHTFFYGGAGGGISYVQFDKMGPDNQFSRYALHFHVMTDSSEGMEVRGSSFRGSGTFWLNIHASNGMNIVDNVGYQAKGAGFYMEHPAGIGNTWLHNLGVDVAPSVKLQHRNSVFWFLLGNSLIDNVGVGAYGGADSSGIFIPQQPRDDPALDHPTVILHNEAHSNRQYGFASWLNLSPEFHVVDMLLWRNADAGFHWGAYGTRFKAHHIYAFENGEYDVEARVKGLELVDSELSGAPIGMFFENPIVNTNPNNPSKIVRTRFANHVSNDVSIDATRECERSTGRCPPMYLQFVEPRLESDTPVQFGWQWDERTRLWFQGLSAPSRTDLPRSFVLVREDQPQPSPDAVKDQEIGAWVAPEEPVVKDMPPKVQVQVGESAGRIAVLPTVTDDGRVVDVEILVNGVEVETLDGAGGGSRVLNLHGPGPSSFLTVRAIDDAGNVAYSRTVELLSQD